MINKVQLIGNLGQDPEIKALQSGNSVVNLSVATAENWKDKNTNEWQSKTEWHRVFGFGFVAKAAENLKKGDQVYVEGSIETNKWQDRDGNDRYTTQIKARVLKKLGRKDQSESSNYDGGDMGFSPDQMPGTGDDVPF